MSGVPQQVDFRRRVEYWSVEVVGIRKSNCDADATSLVELVCSGQQIKNQLNWLSSGDRLELALEMIVQGKPKLSNGAWLRARWEARRLPWVI